MRMNLFTRKIEGMRIVFLVWLAIWTLAACSTGGKEDQGQAGDAAGSVLTESAETLTQDVPVAIYLEEDREILSRMLDTLAPYHADPIGNLVVRAGKLLTGTPYVAHTLEGDEETLVVNLRELDCTTYAENCLAIARTVRSEAPSFDRFLEELKTIRYRDGQLEGYPSRLHYFCDWIHNNAEKGMVRELLSGPAGERDSGSDGELLRKRIDFMSTHPESYLQLEQHPELVELIGIQEALINQRARYYIPEGQLDDFEEQLEEGDIAGITTDIEGLAIMHVVILVPEEDGIHLLHASSAAGKVILSEETLSDYLQHSQRATGIMVARPI